MDTDKEEFIKTEEELFNLLDANQDGELSRTDLHLAAQQLGWHWYHAPLYAVLDLLTIQAPLSRSSFISYMNQIFQDPYGPFGQVLLHATYTATAAEGPPTTCDSPPEREKGSLTNEHLSGQRVDNNTIGDIFALLARSVSKEISDNYRKALQDLDDAQSQISLDKAGLLIIDPQRSFTSGAWKQSIGSNADLEVEPIRMAFDNCARMLHKLRCGVETMFTRCPFPPGSYDWDERFKKVIKRLQLYFVKPGNSVMWPPTNGFREWVERLLTHGNKILVMGGCTLNSCVRVSSIDTMRLFENQGLQVVVDLSISGARTSNFITSSQFGGLSSVESAIQQMREAGVQVVRHVTWR